MTEAEALKRFIPILARISTPQERQIIVRSIQTRIAGQDLRVMAVSHKQVGALAWPGDPVKASQFEESLNAAVDAGEFVSLLHRANQRRHLQIEELCAWPDCPTTALDSPLTFWLDEPAPETDTTTPAPVSDSKATTAPAWSLKRPARFQGYAKPLYDFFKAAHIAGKSRPNARDLLDSWKSNQPPDVVEVTDNGLKYYDAKGNTKPADLDAIRKTIDRMTR